MGLRRVVDLAGDGARVRTHDEMEGSGCASEEDGIKSSPKGDLCMAKGSGKWLSGNFNYNQPFV